jgi:hypothetical protein
MSLRDQLEGVAETIPGWVVLLGGVGGALIALANLISLLQAINAGQSVTGFAWPLFALAFGALLAGYFGYLAVLQARLKRDR